MRTYRVCKRRHANSAFSGNGARLWPGRWNRAGTAVVYTSGSISLMMLEALVHFDRSVAPSRYVVFDVDTPDDLDLEHVVLQDLPKNWRKWPYPKGPQDLGSAWAATGSTVGLVVPSAVVPEERNVILNPLHPDFGKIQISAPHPFRFDKRLVQ
jgi:RES domain-containing protein